MSVRRSIFVLVVVAFALPAFMFSSRANQMRAQNPPRSLQLYTVARGDVEVTITAFGEMEADAAANLSFTRRGRVAELMVQEGDFVLAGDPLVRLDDTVEQLAYQQAELALQSAELALQDLLDGPDEDDIRIAEANVNSAWGAYNAIADAVSDEELQAAQLQYQQAEEALRAAHEARQWAGGEDDEAIALLDAQIGEASFNMEIARLQLVQLQEGDAPQLNAAAARAAQAEAELERARAGATQAEIDAAQVDVEQAQTELDQAARSLSLLTLNAPNDGYVSALNVEVGALVAPGVPVAELTDIDPMHLTIEVDEIDIRQVREGMPAVVRMDAVPGAELPATLERIALVGTEDEGIISYDVDVTLTGSDPRVRVGMTAEAEIVVDSQQNALVVPNQYIRLERRQNRAFVDVMQPDGTLQEVEIQLGLQGEEVSEVVSGLNDGDVIAVDLAGETFSFFGG